MLFGFIRQEHPEFPEVEEILPFLNHVLLLRKDIEILGRPMNDPSPEEMVGLRVLYDEQMKHETANAKRVEHDLDKSRNK